MFILKKWPFINFLLLSITHNVYASTTYKLAYFTLSPHINYCQKSKPCGILVDFLEEQIFNRMKVKIEWIGPLSIPRAVKMLENGKVDALPLAGKVKTNNSKHNYNYSNKELVKGHWYLLYRGKFKKKQITSGKDLLGFNIAFYDSAKKYLHPYLEEEGIKLNPLLGINWFERNFKMMEMGRVDAAVMPEIGPILFILNKYNANDRYQIIPFDGSGLDLHFAFSTKNSKGQKFKENLDKIYNNSIMAYDDYLINIIKK